ncbi:MAG: ATP-grasp domain-containing protein [Streptosporangiaceae bacterium]|jgi:carbamoyl-phosphate synthase large subunit
MSHPNVPTIPLRTVRVLVTGAGGPAAVSVLKSLSADPSVRLIAADMDPWAAGLYLVPPEARTLIPAGLDPGFADAALARCVAMGVDVLIPTVDAELRPLGRARADFRRAGIELLLAPDQALDICLDKLALAECCAGQVPVPRTERYDQADPESWTYPVIVKPRTGSGSRGISLVESSQALARLDASADFLIQEFLPGEEYSIDVLADAAGHVVASVPRVRERVDSGVSVAGRTLHDGELERFGAAVATATGLTYIANVQFRRDAAGRPALLEVNPRVPGTLPLTVASGVDMPRMALDSLRGRPLPDHAGFRDTAMVRYLQECFIELGEVRQVAA